MDAIEMECLKPYFGAGDILQEIPSHMPQDIGLFPMRNIIAGPLDLRFENDGKWKVFGYQNIKAFFDIVKNFDRQAEFVLHYG